jgi:hypothetical protein
LNPPSKLKKKRKKGNDALYYGSTSTGLHGGKFQKIIILITTAVKL